MSNLTAEQIAKYQANRRAKYATDPAHRRAILENNKRNRASNKDQINTARRKRWATDTAFREKQLASRRGRCQRHDQLKVNYGIGLDEYNKMLAGQGGACAICSEPQTETLCVDHCHSTGKIRGLLCRKCNTGLGCYKDNADLMRLAIRYLGREHDY